ncbi:hypothetical protein A2U01_0047932 [Trifolium medium]|uniref:Uncharacterized protein n=1 Tax=Trifolium medium TaxID=97028 RepID=A0A392QU16_9FABA|nr:hypothetical protein [Trifolium medium]
MLLATFSRLSVSVGRVVGRVVVWWSRCRLVVADLLVLRRVCSGGRVVFLDSTLSVLDRCVLFLVVVVATDLRWSGGGCDGSEMEVMRGCGGEVLTWRCWIWRRRCVVDAVCDWRSKIQDSLTGFQIC